MVETADLGVDPALRDAAGLNRDAGRSGDVVFPATNLEPQRLLALAELDD